ncbi:hypothetical protein Ciccas_008914 [Cichlidogyrus casuarinus]|uniref:Receptor L-domain domain-containing protein n=1 Tax=Cichlidogyrus casuarinus TaxID=1844966 RepID=A0ABD2PZH2_9PLAT
MKTSCSFIFVAILVSVAMAEDTCRYRQSMEELFCSSKLPEPKDIEDLNSLQIRYLHKIDIDYHDREEPIALSISRTVKWPESITKPLKFIKISKVKINSCEADFFEKLASIGIESIIFDKVNAVGTCKLTKDLFSNVKSLRKVEIDGELSIQPDAFDEIDELEELKIHNDPGFSYLDAAFVEKIFANDKKTKFKQIETQNTSFKGFKDWTRILDWKQQAYLGERISINDAKFACDVRIKPVVDRLKSIGDNNFVHAVFK